MSAGEHSIKTHAPGTPEFEAHTKFLEHLLSDEQFVAAVKGYTKENDNYDVPFLGGSNNRGDTVYFDRTFAQAIAAGKVLYEGKPFDPRPFIHVHEAIEGAAIRLLGANYDTDNKEGLPGGHEIATWAEHRAVLHDGLDWAKYQASLKDWIEKAEHEKVSNPPPDLLTKAYKGTKQDAEVEGGEHENPPGGYVARKATHSEVNYRHAKSKGFRCATCKHFEPPGSCGIVVDPISSNGWCDRFEKGEQMPWTASDAHGKTHKANSPEKKKQWSATANSVLKRSGDEGMAVRVANAAVARSPGGYVPNKHRRLPTDTTSHYMPAGAGIGSGGTNSGAGSVAASPGGYARNPLAQPQMARNHALTIASATHLHNAGHLPAMQKARIHAKARAGLAQLKQQGPAPGMAQSFGSMAPDLDGDRM